MIKMDINLLGPHRFWFALLAGSVALSLAGTSLLRTAEITAAANLADVKAKRMQTEQALQQLRDDVAAAQKLKNEMTLTEAEQSLAPVDRLQAAAILESAADAAHVHSFSYILSAEQKIQKGGPVSEPQELSLSTITLRGEAPRDTDVYSFTENVRRALPGRMRLQQLSIERTAKNDMPIVTFNVGFNATFEWLSNGGTKNLAGGI